jgi:hypothetical protein
MDRRQAKYYQSIFSVDAQIKKGAEARKKEKAPHQPMHFSLPRIPVKTLLLIGAGLVVVATAVKFANHKSIPVKNQVSRHDAKPDTLTVAQNKAKVLVTAQKSRHDSLFVATTQDFKATLHSLDSAYETNLKYYKKQRPNELEYIKEDAADSAADFFSKKLSPTLQAAHPRQIFMTSGPVLMVTDTYKGKTDTIQSGPYIK